MKRTFAIVLFMLAAFSVVPVFAQEEDLAERDVTRKRLAELLEKEGPAIKVEFAQSQKQPYNYVGTLRDGLANAESFEIVISVTPKDTIGFRIYPHYKNGYINVDKANDPAALMHLLLRLSDRAFLFWGADEAGDVFTGYTFTLESGFPEEAITIVLKSIVNSDKFVGEMRPILDRPPADVTTTTPAPEVKSPTTKPTTKKPGRKPVGRS
jgi:hypothetical protein